MLGLVDTLSRIQDTPISVIDVETTGLSPGYNRVIEIAIVQIKNGEIISEYSTLVNPGRKLPNFIAMLTGIHDSELQDAPYFEEVFTEIKDKLEGSVWAGHNFQFDLGFLRHEFLQCSEDYVKPLYLCTLRLSKKLNPLLRKRNLKSLGWEYRIHNEQSHRALADAKATAQILIKMINHSVEKYAFSTIGDLINFQFNKITASQIDSFSSDIVSAILNAPDSPGVYMFYNDKNEIIYIGKAKSLRSRLLSYVRGKAHSKSKKILRFAKKLKYQITSSELTALFYEAEMIKQILPKHNVMLKSYGSKYFIRINNAEPFPKVEVTNHFNFDGADYFGVFYSRNNAKEFLNTVDKAFQLRECTDKELAKGKGCFLMHIERCLAPCVNKNAEPYSAELESVYNFLYGNLQDVIDKLLHKMKRFVEHQQFEKASEVKSISEDIIKQIHKSSLLQEPINRANLVMVVNSGESKDYLLLKNGKLFIRNYPLSPQTQFDDELNHYYFSREYETAVSEEDLEKLKLMLNWVVKNRNCISIYYLKNYRGTEELYSAVASN